MSQSGRLSYLAATLDRLSVPYMLTGSLVSSLQGVPRSTHDIDIVVDLPAHQIDVVYEAFPSPDFYLSREAMIEAIRTGGMFNVLDNKEGDKFDFWLLTDEPFDRCRFNRRHLTDVDGIQVPVSTPEDTILMKLKWSRDAGGSRRQYRDALNVYELQRGTLNVGYIEQWIVELGLTDEWNRLLAEAKPAA
jgi:hypothetical protein